MTAEPYPLEVQENTGCPRCGLTACSCYDDLDPRWERWIRFYSERWGTSRAATIFDITTHRVQGNEWKLDWEMRDEPRRIALWPPEAFYPRGLEGLDG